MEINGVLYNKEDYERICEKADYYGMCALTEDEQVLLDKWCDNIMEINGVLYNEEDYERICEKADYYGMCALTKDEQVLLDKWCDK